MLYEVGVFAQSVLTEACNKVRRELIEFCINRFRFAVLNRLFRFERDYRQHVASHCRDLDLKVLSTQGIYSLEMKRVFIDLSIAPRPSEKDTYDPVPLQSRTEAAAGPRDIWEYLQRAGHFAIIGAPGSGKTTLLRHIALTLVSTNPKNVPQTLPVLLYLRSHVKAISENQDLSLQEIILASEIPKGQTIKAPRNWFAEKLKDGKCLILLDGLDEIADADTRTKIVAWVEKCIRVHANNRFLITSRPLGYQANPVPGLPTLQILPLKQDQIGRFIADWYLANKAMSDNKAGEDINLQAPKGAADLVDRIRGSDMLADLAANPLMLTIIATTHRFRGELPDRRVELYRQICELFLDKRRAAKGMQEQFTPEQKRFVLESLAYDLMCKQKCEASACDVTAVIEASLRSVNATIEPDAFLRMIKASSGLLLEREPGTYRFAHKTFQDYLAAAYIRSNKLEQYLPFRIEADWWHETIRLFVAEADAAPVLDACLRQTPPSIPALTCAVECIQEARKIDQSWRERIASLIADSDQEHQRLYGEAMLEIRMKKMVRISDDCAVDATLVTNVEYQVFLDEMRRQCKGYTPDHWREPRFSKSDGSRPAAILRYSQVEDFCQWMTARYGGSSWEYTVPSAEQLRAVTLTESRQQKAQDEVGCWSKERRLVGGGHNIAKLRLATERVQRLLIESLEASACAKAIDLVGIFDRARSSAAARDRALAFEHAGDLAFDLARDLARGLARANVAGIARDRNHVFEHDRDPGSVLASAVDDAFAIDRALDRAGHVAFNRTGHLANALERASVRAAALASALDRASEVTSALDLASALGRDRAGDLASALDLGHDRAGDRANVLARDRTGDLASELARDRTRHLANVLARDLTGSNHLAHDLALRTDSDLLFFEKPSAAVQTALLNEVRKGTLVGGIRTARKRASSRTAATATQ